MLLVTTLIIFFIMLIIIIIELQSRISGTIPAPTWAKTRNRMIDLFPESPDGDILELGCGWGSTVLALSKRFPNHHVIGYEITTLPFWMSKLRIALSRRKNITILQKNFMADSFENAGAIFTYLTFRHMKNLEPKFIAELKESAVVVSHSFPLPNIPPATTEIFREGFWNSTVYVYKTPKN